MCWRLDTGSYMSVNLGGQDKEVNAQSVSTETWCKRRFNPIQELITLNSAAMNFEKLQIQPKCYLLFLKNTFWTSKFKTLNNFATPNFRL